MEQESIGDIKNKASSEREMMMEEGVEPESSKRQKTGEGLAKLAHVVSEEERDAREKDPYPLLQQGGLTPEQLAAIQTSMAFPGRGGVDTETQGHLQEGLGQDDGIDPSLQMSIQPQMDALQNLSPDELQAILTGQMYITTAPPPGPEDVSSSEKKWWDEKDEEELFKLIHNEEYRFSTTGSVKLDWRKLEEHFGRSQNALRKKHWLMAKGFHGPYSVYNKNTVQGSAGAKLEGRKRWTEDETNELLRLVKDKAYQAECGIVSELGQVDWKKLGEKFHCDPVVSRRKYKSILKKIQVDGSEEGTNNNRAKRKHHRKKVAYKWMIVAVMDTFPDKQGVAPDIFDAIEANEEFRSQLDYSIAPDTKHVPRWKIQVRKVLSSEQLFVNTGRKVKHETVWKIDPVKLEAVRMQSKQRMGDLSHSQNDSARKMYENINLGVFASEPFEGTKDGNSNEDTNKHDLNKSTE